MSDKQASGETSAALAVGQPHQNSSTTARSWARIVKRYAVPDRKRALRQLLSTVIPLVLLWAAMVIFADRVYWVSLALSVPTAAFLVRLFMIQHDCGHQSFFRSRRWNDILGHAIGVLTLTPHGYWRRAHNTHHATCGDLNRRGIGDIDLLTVREYRALSPVRRFAYRIYRHPLVLFIIGPIYLFVFKFRLPLDQVRRRPGVIASVMATNLAIAALALGVGFGLGFETLLTIHVPIIVLSSSAGVWLFYVQHQFEQTYWRKHDNWNFFEASLYGSSFYDLPRLLSWLTADIGIHHIHHLCGAIPNYRLAECLADNPELRKINRITLRDSMKNLRLSLWDEGSKCLVKFENREIHAMVNNK